MAAVLPHELLEREGAFAQLDADLERTRLGSGRVVLVGGEAGGGKTSLVRAFAARHDDELRVVWGACEALFTPRPLGPVYDIVQRFDDWATTTPTTRAARAALFGALLEELRSQRTIAVFEDVHWADEATLDALKYLGRRVDATPSLIVLTFRDDEVGALHPLRQLLGDLPSASTTRISLEPLSAEAVDELARRADQSSRGLHETTRGNPFFVKEVLALTGSTTARSPTTPMSRETARRFSASRRWLPSGQRQSERTGKLPSTMPARCETPTRSHRPTELGSSPRTRTRRTSPAASRKLSAPVVRRSRSAARSATSWAKVTTSRASHRPRPEQA